jgi:hypothetical protein
VKDGQFKTIEDIDIANIIDVSGTLNIIVCERSKPASLCHCLLVVCHLGSLARAMKKSEDLDDII